MSENSGNEVVVDVPQIIENDQIVVEMPQIGGTVSINLGVGPQGNQGVKGDKGDTGDKGDKGDKGDTGFGIPPGGTTNQWIHKKSDTDFDVEWADLPNTMEIHICTVNEYDAQTGVPTIQNPNVKTFYLVPGGEGNDLYAEWIYINNGWEKFGATTLDLSGFVTDVQVNGVSVTDDGVANVPIKEDFVVNAVVIFDSANDYRPSVVTSDRTVKQVYDAYMAGKNVYAVLTGQNSNPLIKEIPLSNAYRNLVVIGSEILDVSYHVCFSLVSDEGYVSTAPDNGNRYYCLRGDTDWNAEDGVWNYRDTPNEPYIVDFNAINGVVRASRELKDIYYASVDGGNVIGRMTIEEKLQQLQLRSIKKTNSVYEIAFENTGWTISASGLNDRVSSTTWYLVRKSLSPVTDVRMNNTSIIDSNGVANIPVAGWGQSSTSTLGVVKGGEGISVRAGGVLSTVPASENDIKRNQNPYNPITQLLVAETAFYGLAKAAQDTTQVNSSNLVGAYTDGAKEKIQDMLGIGPMIAPTETDPFTSAHPAGTLLRMFGKLVRTITAVTVGEAYSEGVNAEVVMMSEAMPTAPVQDVQVNGTSVVTSGVANVPHAFDTNVNDGRGIGVVGIRSDYGITINTQQPGKYLYLTGSTDAQIKAGTHVYRHISPYTQHKSVFYGLAKAAGDSTQSSSSNAVGTYTESAKSAICEMLNGSISVTGGTPSITAKPGIQYVCGEVSTLDITLPASGIVDVVFESGSTPTVLTITPPSGVTAVKWADGWDGVCEADITYELNILNGELGVKCAWT